MQGELTLVNTGRGDELLWALYYNQQSENLIRADYVDGGLQLNFEYSESARLVSGSGSFLSADKTGRVGLIGFYDSPFTVRMLVTFDGKLDSDPISGAVFELWDSRGVSQVRGKATPISSIRNVLEEVESMLSEDQKVAVGWLGVDLERTRPLGLSQSR